MQKKLNELINKKETGMNMRIFQKHFSFQRPSDILKTAYDTKDKNKNKLVSVIKSGLSDSRNEIEKSDKIVNIVERILEINRQNQEEQGLKILTTDQILSRLPISLAQLKAGNNSEKLKNEIRQLLYYLHRSKTLTKTIYNNLINTI